MGIVVKGSRDTIALWANGACVSVPFFCDGEPIFSPDFVVMLARESC